MRPISLPCWHKAALLGAAGGGDLTVEFPGRVVFKAAHDRLFALALRGAFGHVLLFRRKDPRGPGLSDTGRIGDGNHRLVSRVSSNSKSSIYDSPLATPVTALIASTTSEVIPGCLTPTSMAPL